MRLLEVSEQAVTEDKGGNQTQQVVPIGPGAYQPVPDSTGHSSTNESQQWAEAALLRHSPACPPCQHEAETMGLRKRQPNTTVFHHQPEGLDMPLLVTAEYEPADYECGQRAGWYLLEATLELTFRQASEHPKLKRMLWDRNAYRQMFGSEALRSVEEAAECFARYDAEEQL